MDCDNEFKRYTQRIKKLIKNKKHICPNCLNNSNKESIYRRIKNKIKSSGIVFDEEYTGMNNIYSFTDSFGNRWNDTMANVLTKYNLKDGVDYNKTLRFSQTENNIELFLNSKNIKLERQYKVTSDERYFKIDFRILFDNKEYFIEFNGKQHYEPIEFFGGETAFIKQKIRDKKLRNLCIIKGIPLLEIPYTKTENEVFQMIDEFLYK